MRGSLVLLPKNSADRSVSALRRLAGLALVGVPLLLTAPLASDLAAAEFGPVFVEKGEYVETIHVTLKGQIERGDLARLKKILPEASYADFKLASLHLDSPGGNYDEGLEIAKFILDASISTRIDAGAMCYSACALVFMAGNYHGGNADIFSIDRTLNIDGQLGFHSPSLVVPEGAYDQSAVAKAHMIAIQGLNKFIKIANQRHYHGARAVKAGLMTEMLDRSPEEMFLIDTVDKAGRFDIALEGIAPPDEVSREMLNQACDNALAWNVDEYSDAYDNVANWGDGVQSIEAMDLELGEPTSGEGDGMRAIVEFGGGVKFQCAIDLTYDGEIRFLDTTSAGAPYGTSVTIPPRAYWFFYAPDTAIADLGRQAP